MEKKLFLTQPMVKHSTFNAFQRIDSRKNADMSKSARCLILGYISKPNQKTPA
jgi:hypothetical protein